MLLRISRKLFASEDGVTAIEYGMIAMAIGLSAIVAIQLTGTTLKSLLENSAAQMNTVGGTSDGGGDGGDGETVVDGI